MFRKPRLWEWLSCALIVCGSLSAILRSGPAFAAGACCSQHVQAVGGLTAKVSGPWSAAATWGGRPPQANERVCIPTGITVVLDVDPPALGGLVIDGTLRCQPRETRLTVNWVMVHGLFEVGTAAVPFPNRFVLTLAGTKTSENLICTGQSMGTKFLCAMNGGKLVMNGPSATAWTRLAQDAAAGATQITVDAAQGWRVGDTIVIASRTAVPGQAETRTIRAITGNLVTLDRALTFSHSGVAPVVEGRRLEMRSEVGRLSRSLVIQGDPASTNLKFGGHVMIMAGGVAMLDGVELVRLGQLNRLGRYPFHWHLLGDAPGQYIRNCAVHTSFQRGIVVHGTRRTLVVNNVVLNTPGHNFSIEDPNTINNTRLNNLAIENRIALLTETTLAQQGDEQAANYWIRARGIHSSAMSPPAARQMDSGTTTWRMDRRISATTSRTPATA